MPDHDLTEAEEELAAAGMKVMADKNWLERVRARPNATPEQIRQALAAVQASGAAFKRALARVAE